MRAATHGWRGLNALQKKMSALTTSYCFAPVNTKTTIQSSLALSFCAINFVNVGLLDTALYSFEWESV